MTTGFESFESRVLAVNGPLSVLWDRSAALSQSRQYKRYLATRRLCSALVNHSLASSLAGSCIQ
jgi:hypothetical protein